MAEQLLTVALVALVHIPTVQIHALERQEDRALGARPCALTRSMLGQAEALGVQVS